ncbi:hypothetical protein [Paenibacillus lutrae]|uniref:GTPase SAR1 n=1 Tax=Paenibacillus lutrae TaxID=2078573 RepID=A0A7X3JYT7_9BACL|nr:hypothetical protein [Paenibacillus lutrae]MVO99289.1 hypothetical protein [Paenibacillus lutrae]
MPLRDGLIWISAACAACALLTWVLYLSATRREAKQTGMNADELRSLLSPLRRSGRKQLKQLHIVIYAYLVRVPVISRYTQRIYRRIAPLYAYDESAIRIETAKITSCAILIAWLSVGAILLFYPDFSYMIMILLGALILHGILIDSLVHRAEARLLKQLVEVLSDVRHYYHQHAMVDEAVYDAAQIAGRQIALHAEAIYTLLTSDQSETRLEAYYESAPNRFMKVFAGVSFLVREFGDKILPQGSMYLHALSKISSEIRLEILRQEKLHYMLQGLTIIAIAPILAAKPVESWARNHFPAMDEFYSGSAGFAVKSGIFVLILICFILLRKLQDTSDEAGKQRRRKPPEKKWMRVQVIQRVVRRFMPNDRSAEFTKIDRLLREANSPLLVDWLYLRRLILAAASFLLLLSIFMGMHILTVRQINFSPTRTAVMFGVLSPQEEKKAAERTEIDRAIIEKYNQGGGQLREIISGELRSKGLSLQQTELNHTADRVIKKLRGISDATLSWWQLTLCFISGWMGYHSPMVLLHIQIRMRRMELKNEVDQFHALLSILSQFERMSVEHMLEWLDRFAVQFRAPVSSCLLAYESGAEEALEKLKEEAAFVPFVRIVERLQAAVSHIPVLQAFDDLEAEQQYRFEQRKQEYERMIETKAGWGRWIGFAPMYALVFLYLVIPLVYMSMQQMSTYYEQIQKIS